MTALVFADGARFDDGAGFWMPAAPAIITRISSLITFYDPCSRKPSGSRACPSR